MLDLRKIFLIVLALAYVGLGIYIFIHPMVESKNYNIILAIAFSMYGVWRFYRALKIELI